ncbi:MAG: PhzF family phenazine biosynthesis protein [Marinifilaceae bacterium]|jgi:PhzF family phenazine biosynthesis protein|nr:PhzF family phenazine biosynthesis protein [Marinifilaceae bacterium]
MKLQIAQISAFTDNVFKGNPACVIQLEEWLSDDLMLQIAKENAVAETAFFISHNEYFELRWFTPDIEMDLCGHATLATGHYIFTELNWDKKQIEFKTVSGDIIVDKEGDYYVLNFPSRQAKEAQLPDCIYDSLNIKPSKVLKSRDYLLIYDNEDDIRNIKVDKEKLDQINIDPGGVIVSASSNQYDFVSRFFTPQSTILEDPATGSAHCSLSPYWALELNKDEMVAAQISERSAILKCRNTDKIVYISGKACTYLKGEINI